MTTKLQEQLDEIKEKVSSMDKKLQEQIDNLREQNNEPSLLAQIGGLQEYLTHHQVKNGAYPWDEIKAELDELQGEILRVEHDKTWLNDETEDDVIAICCLLARKVEELYEIIYDMDSEKANVLSVSERRLLEEWSSERIKDKTNRG